MDEIRFVNEYIRDKQTGKEIYAYWCFKRPAVIFVYCAIAFYFASLIYYLSLGLWPEIWMIILAVVFLAIQPIQYFMMVDRFNKQEQMLLHGKPLEVYVAFTESKVFLNRTETEHYIDVSYLKGAFETKNYIVPITKNNMLLILRKDGFTLGNADMFRDFLWDRGIKVRGFKK